MTANMFQQASDTTLHQAAVFIAETQPLIDLKVLHVVNGEHFSGAERVQSHLGRCLPKYGVAADFASVKPGKFPRWWSSRTANGGKDTTSK